ncbi:MAG TPA: metallopeptidase TldD-related protein [Terriglobia bacterium]|nr:metallopeptidase TldD-related protein [Terriglobia bacterium]
MTTKLINVPAWLAILVLSSTFAQQASPPPPGPEDPILRAMKVELERSKAQLKLGQMAAPYYIDYRVFDVDGRVAQASYGTLRTDVRTRLRLARVVVRVGDYKQDSFFGQGEGVVEAIPVDDDELAIRHSLWLATDGAYKRATEALAAKQAQLKQYTVEQPVDDFAHAEPVQAIGPLAKLDLDASPWLQALQEASALYKTDPEVESVNASLDFHVVNRYFVNTEGTIVRSGQAVYEVRVSANTQAADGMELGRESAIFLNDRTELSSPGKVVSRTAEMLRDLKEERAAPVVEEEYRGPVMFSAVASSAVFADLIGENILGQKPGLGQGSRVRGAFASSYKARVLPDFLSVVDDPTLASFNGKPLLGNYEVDDEGVKAQRVSVIEQGKLVNYLMSREPIRDFPGSNGHGRARGPANAPAPYLGNMLVTSSEALPAKELKQKLIDLCRDRGLPYGFYVESLARLRDPRALYKVWVKDGHEELVRGASLDDLDARTLRNDLIAAGDDPYVGNRALNIPHSIVTPSILLDELVVKRQSAKNAKLPEYPAPPLAPAM